MAQGPIIPRNPVQMVLGRRWVPMEDVGSGVWEGRPLTPRQASSAPKPQDHMSTWPEMPPALGLVLAPSPLATGRLGTWTATVSHWPDPRHSQGLAVAGGWVSRTVQATEPRHAQGYMVLSYGSSGSLWAWWSASKLSSGLLSGSCVNQAWKSVGVTRALCMLPNGTEVQPQVTS